jgi:hypothetical protein
VTPTRLRRATALAIAALSLVACGKRGSPVAPQTRVPQAVSDLSAVAREDGIDLAWTPAGRRVDQTRLFDPGVARLYRLEDAGAGEPRAAVRVNDRIAGYTEIATVPLRDPPPPELREGRILYTDRRGLTVGRRYTYVVLTTDAQGRISAPSPRVSVTYIAPPEAPRDLKAEPGDGEVRLAWEPSAHLVDGTPVTGTLTYEILRTPDAGTAATAVGRTSPGATTFVDRGVANDRTFHYAVRGVRAEGGATVLGAASPRVVVTPAKTTPPSPPTDLVAIASRGEVRLSWKPSPAPDVGVYLIYRAGATGDFARVGSVRPPASTFVDRAVPPGRYRYRVTAQDTSTRANESAPSGDVPVTVP